MTVKPFPTFHNSLAQVATVLANIANDPASPHAAAAQAALENVVANTATEEQISEATRLFGAESDDIEICPHALASEGESGTWISAYVLIPNA